MPKPESIQPAAQSKKVTMMIHGYPGVGKTPLIGTGGKGTLIIKPPTEHTDAIKTPGVDVWEVNEWSDMDEVQDYFRMGSGAKDYEWAWLDSISLFQDTGLDNIWADVIAAKPHRAQYGLDKPEYGKNMSQLARWVRHMVGQPGYNFGITGHSFRFEDEAGADESRLWPWVQGKQMSPKICGYMNIVAYLEIVDDRQVIRFKANEDYFARDQFSAFEPKNRMVDPTMPKIMKAIDAVRSGTKQESTKRRGSTRARRNKRSSK